MEPLLLDANLVAIAPLDSFESLLWTDRFNSVGDFELVLIPSAEVFSLVQQDRYLYLKESEHLMIIESLEIKSDIENGDRLIVKGRSLESILGRRIVLDKTTLTGSLQTAISTILTQNAINPTNADRAITKLSFSSSADSRITALEIDTQLKAGENLLTAVTDICKGANLGFKITLSETNTFVFSLYLGQDRSYDQSTNPYVEFSFGFDNLISGDYVQDKASLKTVTLVAGEEGVGNIRKTVSVAVSGGAGTDLARREMFTDASSITKNLPDGSSLSDQQYLDLLTQKGIEDLAKNIHMSSFEGAVETTQMYVYGRDFFMGDIVQVVDDYQHSAKSRVEELIHFQDASGTKINPSFNAI